MLNRNKNSGVLKSIGLGILKAAKIVVMSQADSVSEAFENKKINESSFCSAYNKYSGNDDKKRSEEKERLRIKEEREQINSENLYRLTLASERTANNFEKIKKNKESNNNEM